MNQPLHLHGLLKQQRNFHRNLKKREFMFDCHYDIYPPNLKIKVKGFKQLKASKITILDVLLRIKSPWGDII